MPWVTMQSNYEAILGCEYVEWSLQFHRHLGSQLSEMENVIEKMMEADLVDFAVQDIRYRLEVNQHMSVSEEGTSESEVRM